MTDQTTTANTSKAKRWARWDMALRYLFLAGPTAYVAIKWIEVLRSYEPAIVAEPNVDAVANIGVERVVLRPWLIRKSGFGPLTGRKGSGLNGAKLRPLIASRTR